MSCMQRIISICSTTTMEDICSTSDTKDKTDVKVKFRANTANKDLRAKGLLTLSNDYIILFVHSAVKQYA